MNGIAHSHTKNAFDTLGRERSLYGKRSYAYFSLEKKLKTIPMAGSSLAYVPMMISMVRMFIKKEYTDTPVTSILDSRINMTRLEPPLRVLHIFQLAC